MIPVAKISLSLQLSGTGDGFTLSLDMVMIVPSLRIAMTRTMKGGKSYFQKQVSSMNPSTIRMVMDTA
ncbi:unnamed protein product [Linum trigynum]|uniref:Uncharacterized protein n=1 Tax=Linum trigynum TaxID=586398 RepID=A0AAV2GGQ1_9ROSI